MGRQTAPQIDVVAGIIVDPDNRVLIAKRPDHLDQGGLWEFPGGKREAGESSTQALTRELYEELDIVVERSVPAIAQIHEYPNKIVNLEFFEILKWRGAARGKEGQAVRWVPKKQLTQFAFPPANVPVLNALRLPRAVLCLSAPITYNDQLKKLECCLQMGFSTVVFSARALLPTEQHHQCEQIYNLCEKYGGQLILDCPLEMLVDFPRAGLYLKTQMNERPKQRPVSNERMLVCECHSFDELTQAKMLQADAAFFPLDGMTDAQSSQNKTIYQEFFKQLNFPLMALSEFNSHALYKALNIGCYGIAICTNDWESTPLKSIQSCFDEISASLNSFPGGEQLKIREL